MVRRSALFGTSKLTELAAHIAASGANLTVETPDGDAIAIGKEPTRAHVVFHSAGAVGALLRGDHSALAEAYLRQDLDAEGDLRQALFVTDLTDRLDLGRPSLLRRALVWLRFALDVRAGMRVLDMGCGWGSFLEYAGAQGIRVHGITLSRDQHAFVSELIRAKATS